MGVEDSSGKKLKGRAHTLLEGLFSNDGISHVYLFLVVILLVNLGIGLYFCGRNLNRESELVSSSMFDINVSIPKGSKDKNVINSNYVPRDETWAQGMPEHSQKKTTTTTAAVTTTAPITHENGTSSPRVRTPAVNSLPTCLFLSRFPTKYDLNGLLFWNVSSDMYLYWGYKNKTGSIYLLGNSHQMDSAMRLDKESLGKVSRQEGDWPKIVEFKESKAGSGTRDQKANAGGVVAIGEKSLPPYWYMNWVEQSAAGLRERFKPAFQPCLGSLFTYSNKDLPGFFQGLGVIYMCGFRSYTGEKDLIELTSTPFIKMGPDGIAGDKYSSVVKSRSKNTIYRLAIIKCRDKRGGYSQVMTYSLNLNRPVEEEDCEESSGSWLMYRSGGSLFSIGAGAVGDWKVRTETGKFESLRETGQVKREPCFPSWWSTYGGVKSKQFVPST